MAATRFSVPIPQKDVPIETYKENFKGTISFVKVDPQTGRMEIEFQVLMPGFDYDLSHAGRGPSHGWFFFTCYNSEQAHTLLEVNASRKDKDFIAAINWKIAKKYLAGGKAKTVQTDYLHNYLDKKTFAPSLFRPNLTERRNRSGPCEVYWWSRQRMVKGGFLSKCTNLKSSLMSLS